MIQDQNINGQVFPDCISTLLNVYQVWLDVNGPKFSVLHQNRTYRFLLFIIYKNVASNKIRISI